MVKGDIINTEYITYLSTATEVPMSGRSPTQMDLYIREVKRLLEMKVPFPTAVRRAIGPHGSSDLFGEIHREMTRRSAAARKRKASANKAAPTQKDDKKGSWADRYYGN